MIGPNGAGKTTTLSAVVGLVGVARHRPPPGPLAGRPPARGHRPHRRRAGPQGRHLFPAMTVEEPAPRPRAASRSLEGLDDETARGSRGSSRSFTSSPTAARASCRAASGGGRRSRGRSAKPEVLLLERAVARAGPEATVEAVFATLREVRGRRRDRSARRAARAARRHVLRPHVRHGRRRVPLTLTPTDAGHDADHRHVLRRVNVLRRSSTGRPARSRARAVGIALVFGVLRSSTSPTSQLRHHHGYTLAPTSDSPFHARRCWPASPRRSRWRSDRQHVAFRRCTTPRHDNTRGDGAGRVSRSRRCGVSRSASTATAPTCSADWNRRRSRGATTSAGSWSSSSWSPGCALLAALGLLLDREHRPAG